MGKEKQELQKLLYYWEEKMLRFIVFVFILFSFYVHSVYAEDVEVLEAHLAISVKNRQPVGVAERFPNTVKRVYLWTKIKAKKPPTYIYHVWYYRGKEMAKIKLYIKYSVFRTWSFKTILPQWVGPWRVVVEDINGNPIYEKSFEVYRP